MKKMFFSFVFLLITSLTFANEVVPTDFTSGKISIVETSSKQSSEITLNFADEESFNQYNLKQLVSSFDQECSASVTVTVTVTIGVVSATATVSGIPCSQIVATVEALKADLRNALM
jgi:hypothetical protein